jgi:hypothetical protein
VGGLLDGDCLGFSPRRHILQDCVGPASIVPQQVNGRHCQHFGFPQVRKRMACFLLDHCGEPVYSAPAEGME